MTEASPQAIRAERLCKRFGETVAVADVSFEIGRGEVVGFLGPNGAGKSTTLRMLTGVFPPSSGRAIIDGRDVVRDPLGARRCIGYLPERTALYGDMTVEGYLSFVAEMKQLERGSVRSAVGRAMEATATSHVSHRLVGDLSKGYRQRVGLAQALLGDPRVLVLDEPTSGLDPEQVTDIRSLVRSLGADRTVLLSTHILPEVEAVCSRVLIINRGRIVAADHPRRLEERLRPSRETLVRVAGDESVAAGVLAALPGVLGVGVVDRSAAGTAFSVRSPHATEPGGGIAAALVGRGLGVLELRPVAMTLEEIFLALVAEDAAAGPAGDPGSGGDGRA